MQNVSNPNIMSMMLTGNSKKKGDKTYESDIEIDT